VHLHRREVPHKGGIDALEGSALLCRKGGRREGRGKKRGD